MQTITLYRLNADPAGVSNLNVLQSFTVTITDDDPIIEGNDASGAQLDLSSVPNISNSTNFQVFETYSGTSGGNPVTFTLVQWNPVPYIFVVSGSVSVGQPITGTGFGIGPGATPVDYSDLPDFVCFTAGTRIETPGGLRLIEDLKAGDRVVLANGTCRPISWIGRRKLSRDDLKAAPHLRPIRFKAGSMGAGRPARDVWLSPQHRVAVTAVGLDMIIDAPMMLASAKSLVNGTDVLQQKGNKPVEYIHIMFDRHEVVNVDGLMCETLFPGETTLDSMSEKSRGELFELFPELEFDPASYGATVLPVMKPYETRVMHSALRAPQKADMQQISLH